MNIVSVKTALLSVSDKTGLVELAQALARRGVKLLSTGGTASALRDNGLDIVNVEDITGFPEMLDGRVKTLHPTIHGALLAMRNNPEHIAAMQNHGIEAIDLLVVNLYPFEAALRNRASYDEMVENIDIGGPAMIRAAAKNHAHVCTIVEPQDYSLLIDELDKNNGATGYSFRQRMAANAYARTASYDAAVSGWFAREVGDPPRRFAVAGTLSKTMRYGENPHQTAAFYTDGSDRAGVATAHQHQGKALSYNNINDTDAAFELVSEFASETRPACAIIKHANPCGVAIGDTLSQAYTRAFECDQTSAFGGIIALNRPLDRQTAKKIIEIFAEVVIAPGASEEAIEIFSRKPNLRLLTTETLANPSTPMQTIRHVSGGYLVQDKDVGQLSQDEMRVVTKRAPNPSEMDDLRFAWRVAKHVKSNAIVYARDGATVGIGAGQMNRLDSALIATTKAERMAQTLGLDTSPANGSVVASDAFFPFPDGLLEAAQVGATAAIQPGGSIRDAKVIEAADHAGIAMVFTGMRHFRH